MNTNRPAFPSTHTVTTATGIKLEDHDPGMTLRDYFAAQALIGIISNPGAQGTPAELIPDVARAAYMMADAMLKARGG